MLTRYISNTVTHDTALYCNTFTFTFSHLADAWVFKSFLKVKRDAPALAVLGSSFHQRGTTNEISLDCRTCTDGSAKRYSLDNAASWG